MLVLRDMVPDWKAAINHVVKAKCEEFIPLIPDESIDLIVTSPPYNVDLGNNKYNKSPYDLYNDNADHQQYIDWMAGVFYHCYYKLKVGGRLCINIGDGKNGAVPTSSDLIYRLAGIGDYIPMTHIIWDKSQIGNRTAWGSFQSPSSPSFPTPFEHILLFAKESRKLQFAGETDLTKEEFIEWSLALWKFQPETQQKKMGHPAMFPVELPRRLIKMLSWKDALVFDPFAGLFTTAVAAKELGRNWLGCEISEEYCRLAERRLANV